MFFNGCEIHKKEVENPKGHIVLIHGFASDYRKRLFISNSLEEYNFYFINLPNHGNSLSEQEITVDKYINILISYIESLNVDRVILYGHSMGGGLVLILQSILKDKIEKVILESPINISALKKTESIVSFLENKNNVIKNISNFLINKNKLKELNPVLLDNMKTLNNLTNNPDILNIWKEDQIKIWDEKISESIKDNKIPTIVFLGKKDLIIPYKESCELFSKNSSYKIISLDNCGHFPALEKPFTLIKEIISFLSD